MNVLVFTIFLFAHNTLVCGQLYKKLQCPELRIPKFIAPISGQNMSYFIKSMVKVKSLHLTKHHTMKAFWGSGGIAPHIL
jgi:hypothetical protein